MLLKNMARIFFSSLVLSLPLVTYANTLNTINHTTEDSTVFINNVNECSAKYGEMGITRAGRINQALPLQVRKMCDLLGKNGNCSASIYMTSNCNMNGAKPIATAEISIAGNTITLLNLVILDSEKYSITKSDIAELTITSKK